MKKIVFLAIIIFALNAISLYAQNFKGKSQDVSISEPEKELRIGETLEYSLEWLGIPMGRIVLKVEGISMISNYECYHVSARAIPNRIFRHFYDVEYWVHTYLDKKILLPRRFEKIRHVNGIFSYIIIDFNLDKNEATYRYYSSHRGPLQITEFPSNRKIILSDWSCVVKTLPEVNDLFSSLYRFRLMRIKENGVYTLNIAYAQKDWPVKIKIEKPFMKDIYKKGTFGVIKVTPYSDLNDCILGRRRILAFFTADSRRIPLEFDLATAIGSIRGIIQDIPK